MFKARYLLPNHNPPGRIYVHAGYLKEAFSRDPIGDTSLDNAINYGMKTLSDNQHILERFGFFIGIVGSDINIKREKILTLYTSNIPDNWKQSRLMFRRHLFKNGLLVIERIYTLEEDHVILLGKEGEFRKTRENLEDYMKRFPHLGKLEPKRGFGELFRDRK